MQSHKIAFKLFVEDPSQLKLEDFVPVYHRWIQRRALADHQLIDVADYKHVQEGPGTVLIAHEANIHADLGDGRLGLLYVRKQPLEGLFARWLRTVLGYTLGCASMLEDDESLRGRIRFRTDEAILRIYDRLHAPNTQETFDSVRPDLETLLTATLGPEIRLSHKPDRERLFEVSMRSPQARSIGELVAALKRS
jgi:hypothetical protein